MCSRKHQVEVLRAFRHEVSQSGPLIRTRDTVRDGVREAHPQRHRGAARVMNVSQAWAPSRVRGPKLTCRWRPRARAPSAAGLWCRERSGCVRPLSRHAFWAGVLAMGSSSASSPVTVETHVSPSPSSRTAASGVGCSREASRRCRTPRRAAPRPPPACEGAGQTASAADRAGLHAPRTAPAPPSPRPTAAPQPRRTGAPRETPRRPARPPPLWHPGSTAGVAAPSRASPPPAGPASSPHPGSSRQAPAPAAGA